MFNIDGKRSTVSHIAQTILDTSGLPLEDPWMEDSLSLVLYRKDPLDGCLYLTAFAGIREQEPLFGPLSWEDYKRRLDHRKHADSNLGFRKREGTFRIDTINRKSWQLFVNGRNQESPEKYNVIKDRLISSLE